MIVVDTNVVVYAVVHLPQTALARQVAARDSDWVLPSLWRYEFTSAVTKMTRGLALSAAQAEVAIVEASRLVAGRERDVDQLLALRVALALGLSAYDASYVALAENLGLRCVTADARVVKCAPAIAVSLADFANGIALP